MLLADLRRDTRALVQEKPGAEISVRLCSEEDVLAISMADMRRTPEGYFTVRWGEPEYTDWIDESMSWKETCYIGDWSFLWERRFRGPEVLKLFSDLSVNSFAKFALGQSKHVIHCTEAGKIIREGILSRLGEEEYMLFGRAAFGSTTNCATATMTRDPSLMIGSISRCQGPRRFTLLKKPRDRAARRGFYVFRKDPGRRPRDSCAATRNGWRNRL